MSTRHAFSFARLLVALTAPVKRTTLRSRLCARPAIFQCRPKRAVCSTPLTPQEDEEVKDASVRSISGGNMLNVSWSTGSDSRFHSIWLRHNCQCNSCKQDASGQKFMDVAEFPETLTISQASVKGGNVELIWQEEPDHQGIVPLHFLKDNCYDQSTLQQRSAALRPHAYTKEDIPCIAFEDIRDSSEGLLKLMSTVQEFGMCLVRGMRKKWGGAIELAEMISPIQHTIYGKKFDVVSTPEPINIAYSSVHLDLHMDLAYYESPPGLQVFNCVRFDNCVEGGESTFLDVFPVAEDFRSRYPREFHDLTRIPATFQKIHFNRVRPVYMTYKRPHIALSPEGEITGIFWSPAFEGPLSVAEEDVDPYYKAHRLFSRAIRKSPLRKTFRLAPGVAIVFNNRRMLHGRTEFSLNGGQRHFEGCYVNIDEFKSHFRYLSHVKGSELGSHKRVGNQCWF